MSHSSVIAIDGPSGSGKSTVAKTLAKELGIVYIDTGAMFRALAFVANERGIEFSESNELQEFLKTIKVEYQSTEESLIKIDGQDLTELIREHSVSKLASSISQISSVRSYLLDFQRSLAKSKTCVMEGRDIGTVVFPKAFCKFYVTASIEVRAQRRFDQLLSSGQTGVNLEQLIEDVQKRDDKDIGRDVAPLKVADDALLVDTSDMTLDLVISHLKKQVTTRSAESGINL